VQKFDLIVETDRPDVIKAIINAVMELDETVWRDRTLKATAMVPDATGQPTFRQLAGDVDTVDFEPVYSTHSDGWSSFNTVEDEY
jgi:hypothetical protein